MCKVYSKKHFLMSIYLWNKTIVNYDMKWPCPDWFHVPLLSEINALKDAVTWLWLSFSPDVYLKMPLAWLREYSNWNVVRWWQWCRYWSSTCYNDSQSYTINETSVSRDSKWRWWSVRWFYNKPVVPDSSRTTISQWSWSAWIFHSPSLWLISISSDWTNWITIADKNVWATTVYNNWDTLSESNCWWFFQWWNNYMFPYSWSVTTSSTRVNASSYWPWNYYNGSTFITTSSSPYNWDSSGSTNLWWWVTQWTSTVTIPAEIKNLYIWANEAKEVYVGTDKVRPKIINFATQWPCPDWFHVPLSTDWKSLIWILTNTFWLAVEWSTINTYLKMPYAWRRAANNAGLYYQGSEWYYRSSSRYDGTRAYHLISNSYNIVPNNYLDRAYGMSIRAFKNTPVVPNSSWTKLYQWSWNAWIFWNSTDWLISVSWNWTTWYTIADKNLGATTVYNSWNTLSEANCGKYYQWWNNYWFPWTWTISDITYTQVDASANWPWNYYSSSTFYKKTWRWDSTDNWNLWWWVDWNVPV